MSEKRFEKSKSDITDYRIYDYEKEDAYFIDCDDESTVDAIVGLLNELSDENNILNKNEDDLKECTIENIKLREENDKLKGLIKENVFGRYREGSLADLEFKAIAYDDIVELEMSDELEPKVIVICKQGKKENVKSFCQMFIPLGVHYEIKEVIE